VAARKKKTWQEKLAHEKDLPKVIEIEEKDIKRWGGKTLAVPRPRDVDAFMRKVPKGKLITIAELRQNVAKLHQAEAGCPITCGIFAWIAAHAAEEAAAEGKKRITPWWRTLKTGGELNPKYPGGLEAHRRLLEAEGHSVIVKGKRAFVVDFGKKVVGGGGKG
jgi:alkylated DNA nucleotide flippase Atl1